MAFKEDFNSRLLRNFFAFPWESNLSILFSADRRLDLLESTSENLVHHLSCCELRRSCQRSISCKDILVNFIQAKLPALLYSTLKQNSRRYYCTLHCTLFVTKDEQRDRFSFTLFAIPMLGRWERE